MKVFILKHGWRVGRQITLAALCGILAGVGASAFLYALKWATDTRDQHPALIWGLPLAGLLIGLLYHQIGRDSASGSNLILDEIHNPKKVLPLSMAPLVLVSTLLTHLFGGSAGREGTAVQIGASLSDQLTRIFRLPSAERKLLLAAGMSAGFGAAIGAPWAGTIFGMEVIAVGRLRVFAGLECFVASFVAFWIAVKLGTPHSHFSIQTISSFDLGAFSLVALAGILFGLASRSFVHMTHLVEHWFSRAIKFAPLRPLLGGCLLVGLYHLEASFKYVGLGIPVIHEALSKPDSIQTPVLKLLFTTLTIGAGFKGGEFIPLVFIGTTLGSALSTFLNLPFGLLGAVGFAAVFAGAANTPIACSLMAIELFGWPIAPYAIVGCFVSYWCSGRRGIYRSQRGHA